MPAPRTIKRNVIQKSRTDVLEYFITDTLTVRNIFPRYFMLFDQINVGSFEDLIKGFVQFICFADFRQLLLKVRHATDQYSSPFTTNVGLENTPVHSRHQIGTRQSSTNSATESIYHDFLITIIAVTKPRALTLPVIGNIPFIPFNILPLKKVIKTSSRALY